MGFALFFLAEYSSMILMSALTTLIFLGGWLFNYFVFFEKVFFGIKICLVLFFFYLSKSIFS
jgi:NADH-quinone oxidoreductase subunit H